MLLATQSALKSSAHSVFAEGLRQSVLLFLCGDWVFVLFLRITSPMAPVDNDFTHSPNKISWCHWYFKNAIGTHATSGQHRHLWHHDTNGCLDFTLFIFFLHILFVDISFLLKINHREWIITPTVGQFLHQIRFYVIIGIQKYSWSLDGNAMRTLDDHR